MDVHGDALGSLGLRASASKGAEAARTIKL